MWLLNIELAGREGFRTPENPPRERETVLGGLSSSGLSSLLT